MSRLGCLTRVPHGAICNGSRWMVLGGTTPPRGFRQEARCAPVPGPWTRPRLPGGCWRATLIFLFAWRRLRDRLRAVGARWADKFRSSSAHDRGGRAASRSRCAAAEALAHFGRSPGLGGGLRRRPRHRRRGPSRRARRGWSTFAVLGWASTSLSGAPVGLFEGSPAPVAVDSYRVPARYAAGRRTVSGRNRWWPRSPTSCSWSRPSPGRALSTTLAGLPAAAPTAGGPGSAGTEALLAPGAAERIDGAASQRVLDGGGPAPARVPRPP